MIKKNVTLLLAAMAGALVCCTDESFNQNKDARISSFENQPEYTTLNLGNPSVLYSYESLCNGTVKFSIHNQSGLSVRGGVMREGVSYQQNLKDITEFTTPDGDTYTFIDDNVIPDESYSYLLYYFVDGAPEFEYYELYDTVSVVSHVPALGHFLLLPPECEEPSYDFLFNGQAIEIANTNILIESDQGLTRSVVFNLNGVKYTDNSYPFTLFPECTANLPNGSYSLTAIAYPKKKGKGIPGDTATVSFTVNNLY